MALPLMALGSGLSSLLGGGMSLFGKSRPESTTQLQQLTPEQQQGQLQALQMALQGMQDPGAGFDPIAQQATEQFRTETIPGLAERFTSMGEGAQRSSAFQGALGRAGAGLGSQLAAQRSQYGLQRMSGLENLLGMGLGNQFENVYKPEQMSPTQALGGQLANSGIGGLMSSIQGMQLEKASSDRRGWDDAKAEIQRNFQSSQSESQRKWLEGMLKKYPNFKG